MGARCCAGKQKYPHLFESIRIGNIRLKNRIIAAPTSPSMMTTEGHFTPEMIAYLEEKATGFKENIYTVRAAVGDELPKYDNVLCDSTNCVMYYRPYANKNGRYKELWMSDYFRDKVINITHLMNIGDDIQLTHNGNDTVAVVFAKFNNQQEMLATIDNMSEHLRVITE